MDLDEDNEQIERTLKYEKLNHKKYICKQYDLVIVLNYISTLKQTKYFIGRIQQQK